MELDRWLILYAVLILFGYFLGGGGQPYFYAAIGILLLGGYFASIKLNYPFYKFLLAATLFSFAVFYTGTGMPSFDSSSHYAFGNWGAESPALYSGGIQNNDPDRTISMYTLRSTESINGSLPGIFRQITLGFTSLFLLILTIYFKPKTEAYR